MKRKFKKLAWEVAQDKFEKKSLNTKCGKLGGKYPTRKTCPKECDFVDMGSGGSYCNPKKSKKVKRGGGVLSSIKNLVTSQVSGITSIPSTIRGKAPPPSSLPWKDQYTHDSSVTKTFIPPDFVNNSDVLNVIHSGRASTQTGGRKIHKKRRTKKKAKKRRKTKRRGKK